MKSTHNYPLAQEHQSSVRFQLHRQYLNEFFSKLDEMLAREDVTNVCDIGGGANPSVGLDKLEKYKLNYTLLDISAIELEKSPSQYNKVQADIASSNFTTLECGQYDFAMSMMLAEHVSDGEIFHRNVFNLLRDGGYALHLFPTLYEPSFVINRLLPEKLSSKILGLLAPHRINDANKLKFPAYYSWCFGPTKEQLARFESIGYRVVEFQAYFGTPYFRRVPPLQNLMDGVSNILVKHPVPQLTSYACLLLQKR